MTTWAEHPPHKLRKFHCHVRFFPSEGSEEMGKLRANTFLICINYIESQKFTKSRVLKPSSSMLPWFAWWPVPTVVHFHTKG